MAIIRQKGSKYTVELTGKDKEDYLKKRFPTNVLVNRHPGKFYTRMEPNTLSFEEKKNLIKRMKKLNLSGDIDPLETESAYWKRKASQIKALSKTKNTSSQMVKKLTGKNWR